MPPKLKVGSSVRCNLKGDVKLPDVPNKTALITGASSGLGAEFASQLATRGYDLILVARQAERLEQLGNSLSLKHGIHATALPADLSTMSGIERVVQVISNTSNLEVLVNNAGFWLRGRLYRIDPEKIQALLLVHMTAPVLFCRAALPGMVTRNVGWIINVSSLYGYFSMLNVLYGSTKNFQMRFSEALQAELHNSQVKVQALCPGFVHTEFLDTPELENFSSQSIPRFMWMTSQQVVSESLNSLAKNKVVCIPGNFYKFVGVLARNSFTAGLITSVARRVLRRRKH